MADQGSNESAKAEVKSVVDDLLNEVEIKKEHRDNDSSLEQENSGSFTDEREEEEKKEAKEKPGLNKNRTALKCGLFLLVVGGVSYGSIKTYSSYKESTAALASKIEATDNSMQILNTQILNLKSEIETLKSSQEILKDLEIASIGFNQDIDNLSLKYSEIEGSILRIDKHLESVDLLLEANAGLSKEVRDLKAGLGKLRGTLVAKQRTSEAAVVAAKPKLQLLSVDWWNDIPQAVFLTEAGETIFLMQGERYQKWSLVEIDVVARQVSLNDGRKTHDLTAPL